MKIYVIAVAAYFLAFLAFNAWLLAMAYLEIRRYDRRLRDRSLRDAMRSPLAPPISVLVPAFNEEAGIADSVRSLLALDYPTFEVVVISDGSSDETVARMVEAFDLRRVERPTPPFVSHAEIKGVYVPRGKLNVLLLDKDNGGKADSLNAGINFASYPLVCAIDADSVLEQDALIKTAAPFLEDPVGTVATGGLVRIANGCRIEGGQVIEERLPRTALPMFQVVEYLRAFFGARTGWSAVNGLLIISGAFGVFRKDAVIAAGGLNAEMRGGGEDMEVVVRLHRWMRRQGRPYRVVYVPDPICWTEAPETLGVLRRQRQRWQRGSGQTLMMHRGMLGNPRYRSVGLIAMPELLVFELLGPIVEVSGYIVSLIAFLTGAISLPFFLLFLAIAMLYGLILTFGAIALEDASFGRHPGWKQLGRLFRFALLDNLGYRQLTTLWRLEGLWQLVRGSGEWGAMERKGLSRPVPEEALAEEVGLR
jgi:cellulose synthase/poly-beta-1,6-N-acetylglucosamine synthase-like glycosyltransferase